ncbi:MAG: hypothetical protein L3J32_04370 [Rhizobiaceae bacterium]|nr:hypothetical protein [Rhizobiaceae bacterium]
MKARYLYLLLCGLVVAGIVHITIIILIPDYGSRDAWNIISGKRDMWVFSRFTDDGKAKLVLEDTDPYLEMGACTFDLSESGLRFTGTKSTIFWSVSVFEQDGRVVYSLNNRTAIDNRLDLILLNPVQMINLREAPPEEIERSVVVEADIKKGFVILRQFKDSNIDKDAVGSFFSDARCTKYSG